MINAWRCVRAESRPIIARIKTWLDARHQQELPRSPLRAGVNYLRNPAGKPLSDFSKTAESPSTTIEPRPPSKDPLWARRPGCFLGSEQAGETAAIFYTLTMSCKRHCIDVGAYLLDVFRRIRTATPAELESLLPDRWIQDHPAARVRQRVQESHAAATRKRQRRAQRRRRAASG